MSPMISCPDCGTSNKADADLCAQCWREISDGAVSRIPVAAFATAAPASAAPPPPVAPQRYIAPRRAPEALKPREAEPGPVPYFAPIGPAPTSVGFPLPSTPSPTTTTTTRAFPLGKLVALAVVAALLGGGYYFLFGRSSGAFSPEDGSYTMELPDGWERSEEHEETWGDADFAVHPAGNELTMIAGGHSDAIPGAGGDQVRSVMTMIQQFVPKLPGSTMSAVQESTLVSGEGVSAYEMTGTVSAAGQAKMRFVAAVHEPSSTMVFMMVACHETTCSTAEPVFQEMAGTLEFSG